MTAATTMTMVAATTTARRTMARRTTGKKADGPKADIGAGKTVYLKKCKSCHGADGKGDTKIGKKVDIPSLAGTKMSKSKIKGVIENGVKDTKMKAYKSKLSAEEIDNITAFVKTL